MAELRIAVVHYEHKQLDVARDDFKGQSIGTQIDAFIAETLGKSVSQNGGPSSISEVNLMFDIDEQHVLLEQFMRHPDATTRDSIGKKRKPYDDGTRATDL